MRNLLLISLIMTFSILFFGSVGYGSDKLDLINRVETSLLQKYNEWDVDGELERAIDRAILELKHNRGYIEKLWAKISSQKRKEFVADIMEYISLDDKLNERLETFVTDALKVARNIVIDWFGNIYDTRINKESMKIKERYGEKIATYFLKFVHVKAYLLSRKDVFAKNLSDVIAKDPTLVSKSLLVSAGALYVTRIVGERAILSGIRKSLFRRVAPEILTTTLRVVNWVLFLYPILYEIVTPNSTIDSMEKELKSPKIEKAFRDSLINYILRQISENYVNMLSAVGEDIDNLVHDFETGNKRLLKLFDTVDGLKEFADTLTDREFGNLVLFIDKAKIDTNKCKDYLENGVLKKIAKIPASSFDYFLTILEDTSIDTALKWVEKAEDLRLVVKYNLHREISPEDLTQEDILSFVNVVKDRKVQTYLETFPKNLKIDIALSFPREEIIEIATSDYKGLFIRLARDARGREVLVALWRSLIKRFPKEAERDKVEIEQKLSSISNPRKQIDYIKHLHTAYAIENNIILRAVKKLFEKANIDTETFNSNSYELIFIIIFLFLFVFIIREFIRALLKWNVFIGILIIIALLIYLYYLVTHPEIIKRSMLLFV